MSKKTISFAFGLSEYAPIIKRWLECDCGKKNAQTVKDLAASVTGAKEDAEIFKLLSSNQEMVAKFQSEIMNIAVEVEKNLQKENNKKLIQTMVASNSKPFSSRSGTMVLCAVLGLALCLGVLSFQRQALSGEAVGIISTIAGIFGSCLKDAYSNEFSNKNQEPSIVIDSPKDASLYQKIK